MQGKMLFFFVGVAALTILLCDHANGHEADSELHWVQKKGEWCYMGGGQIYGCLPNGFYLLHASNTVLQFAVDARLPESVEIDFHFDTGKAVDYWSLLREGDGYEQQSFSIGGHKGTRIFRPSEGPNFLLQISFVELEGGGLLSVVGGPQVDVMQILSKFIEKREAE